MEKPISSLKINFENKDNQDDNKENKEEKEIKDINSKEDESEVDEPILNDEEEEEEYHIYLDEKKEINHANSQLLALKANYRRSLDPIINKKDFDIEPIKFNSKNSGINYNNLSQQEYQLEVNRIIFQSISNNKRSKRYIRRILLSSFGVLLISITLLLFYYFFEFRDLESKEPLYSITVNGILILSHLLNIIFFLSIFHIANKNMLFLLSTSLFVIGIIMIIQIFDFLRILFFSYANYFMGKYDFYYYDILFSLFICLFVCFSLIIVFIDISMKYSYKRGLLYISLVILLFLLLPIVKLLFIIYNHKMISKFKSYIKVIYLFQHKASVFYELEY